MPSGPHPVVFHMTAAVDPWARKRDAESAPAESQAEEERAAAEARKPTAIRHAGRNEQHACRSARGGRRWRRLRTRVLVPLCCIGFGCIRVVEARGSERWRLLETTAAHEYYSQ